MIALALRIIVHRPMRYLVALLGISVAAGLAFIQLGLYRGFRENASVVVDHTRGDLWVCASHHKNFDFPNLLSREQLDQVRSTPGVAWAHPLLIIFADWKISRELAQGDSTQGEEVTVQVIGFDAERGIGQPWTMIEGFPQDLAGAGAISVDVGSSARLGYPDLGSETEINGIKVHVAGLTSGIRSFQGNPMIFCDLETARNIARMSPDDMHYAIVGVSPNAEPEEVLERLREIENADAHAAADFSRMAQDYWLKTTGAGTALALAALMGLVVGIVVAGQVLYTSTLEHIKEYGTLKAIGATNAQVAGAIVSQAVAWALPAHLIAGGLLLFAMKTIQGKGINPSLDGPTYAVLGIFTVFICVMASLLSVFRVLRVEPADVFRG